MSKDSVARINSALQQKVTDAAPLGHLILAAVFKRALITRHHPA
jgi:hypothetical protein